MFNEIDTGSDLTFDAKVKKSKALIWLHVYAQLIYGLGSIA